MPSALSSENAITAGAPPLPGRPPAASAIPWGSIALIALSALICALGLAVMAGWLVGSRALVQVYPTFAPMQFNTAAGFALSGAALLALCWNRNRMGGAFGGAAALVGALTLIEYVAEVDLGIDRLLLDIDQLVLTHDITMTTSHPGRMTPNTALCFALIGSGLAAFAALARRPGPVLLLGLLSVSVAALALASLIGHATGLERAQDGRNFTYMAPHTSLGFLVLGVAGFGTAHKMVHGVAASRSYVLSVVPVGLLSVVAALSLWEALKLHEENLIKEKAALRASTLSAQIEFLVQSQLDGLDRMTGRWIYRDRLSKAAWEADAARYIAQNTGLQTIQWTNSTGWVRWIMPLAGNRESLDEDLPAESVRQRALASARRTGQPFVSRAVDLMRGGKGFLAFVPIGRKATFDGFMVGVFRFKEVFGTVLRLDKQKDWNVAIIVNGKPVYRNRLYEAGQRTLSQTRVAEISNLKLQIRVWPSRSHLRALVSPLNNAMLATGMLMALLLTLMAHQWQIRRGQVLEIDRLRRRNQSILDAAGEGIYGVDLDGRCTFANPAAARMVGYTSEELVGRLQPTFFRHGHGDVTLMPGDRRPGLKTLETGNVHRVDNDVYWRKDGSHFPVDFVSSPTYDADGALSGAVVVFRDISELRGTQQALQMAVVDLEATNAELEAFSYSVSHDLRAPLRALDGFSQALVEDSGDRLDDGAREYLQRIRAASQRMGRLIDDLLTLSRITRSKVERKSTDLSEIADAILAELRDGDPDRTVSVRLQPGIFGDGDPRLLRILLGNLIGNAWKFTSQRTSAEIEFGTTEEDGRTVYFVRDNGAGFSMEYADKLFAPFKRLHSAAEFDGTGIGLATVSRIIARHGGRIWAEAEPDAGATFYFTLDGDKVQ